METEVKIDTKGIVKEGYKAIATGKGGCCSCKDKPSSIALAIGYSQEELASVGEANMGLGCGNPTALGIITTEDVVLDLGSGAGIDCILASKKAKNVIGVDFTQEMIDKARKNVEAQGITNVEFIKGDIEALPLEDSSVDVIMSNCVINLATSKEKVFQEAKRVLKPKGRMYVSDIVLLSELTEEQRKDEELITGCVAGALLKEKYLRIIKKTGLTYEILGEDTEISKTQYNGVHLESLKLKITNS